MLPGLMGGQWKSTGNIFFFLMLFYNILKTPNFAYPKGALSGDIIELINIPFLCNKLFLTSPG